MNIISKKLANNIFFLKFRIYEINSRELDSIKFIFIAYIVIHLWDF